MKTLVSTLALLLISISSPLSAATPKEQVEAQYAAIMAENWVSVFDDSMSYLDYAKWVLDGRQGVVRPTSEGLMLSAGPRLKHDSDHIVLWNKIHFEGDLKVEYDFTRIDNSAQGSVNIIYLHAQGSEQGPYTRDIMEWNELRDIPSMRLYYNNMRLYHISYAVTDYPNGGCQMIDYVRARQYMPNPKNGVKGLAGTNLTPEYMDSGLFKVGRTYRITVTLRHNRLYMHVVDKKSKKSELMWFDIDPAERLNDGYIGLRQMWGRTSRYANFRVSQIAQ